MPSPSKVVSGFPSEVYRTAAKEPSPEVPATTMFPPASMATALAESYPGAMSVITTPLPLKVPSGVPSGSKRRTANFPAPTVPATTICPSAWMATSPA